MRHSIYVTLFSLLMSSSALAAPATTAEGAKVLQGQVQALLDKQAATFKASNIILEQKGILNVEPASGYYAVTTPEFKLKFPDESQQNFGMFAINAIPHEVEGRYKIALALPKSIIIRDSKGQEIGTATIGQQSFSGVYDFGLQSFVDLDAKYKDFVVKDKTGSITIPSISMRNVLKDNGQGLLSGPRHTQIEGLEIQNAQGEVNVKNIDIKIDVQGLDASAAPLFQSSFLKSLTREAHSFSEMGIGYLIQSAEDFELNVSASGIRSRSVQTPQHAPSQLQIASANVNVNGQALKTEKANVQLKASTQGMDGSGFLIPETLFPARFTLQANFTDLPVLEHGTSTVFQQFLSRQSATTFKELSLENDSYSFSATGNLKLDNTAAFKVAGDTVLRMRGIDNVMDALKSPALKNAPPLLGVFLSMAQLMGEPDTDKQGREIRTIKLELGKDGSVALNGVSLVPALKQ